MYREYIRERDDDRGIKKNRQEKAWIELEEKIKRQKKDNKDPKISIKDQFDIAMKKIMSK